MSDAAGAINYQGNAGSVESASSQTIPIANYNAINYDKIVLVLSYRKFKELFDSTNGEMFFTVRLNF